VVWDVTRKSGPRKIRGGMEPYLKKLVFFLLLSLLLLCTSYAATKDMEVYIDVPLHLELVLSNTQVDFGELDEAGEEISIDVNIRSNIKSWKVSAKATYASLTWGAEPDGTWVVPTAPLKQISYKVTFSDTSPVQTLFSLATLPVNVDQTLYTFTRRTNTDDLTTDLTTKREKFSFTVHVDPKAPTADWEAGEYQDTITLTVTSM